jgi:hypothetical protein
VTFKRCGAPREASGPCAIEERPHRLYIDQLRAGTRGCIAHDHPPNARESILLPGILSVRWETVSGTRTTQELERGVAMNTISKWLAMLPLLFSAAVSHAQTATYAFTGVVTKSDFPVDLEPGAYVTGTYTFNYNSADQIIGSEPGASIAPFAIGSFGVPYNPVFAAVIKIGHFTYRSSKTAPPGDPDDSSVVTGNGATTLSASEATPAFETGSYFTIVENDIDEFPPYTTAGYPVTLSARQSGYGGLNFGSLSLRYQITSLRLAPVPPPPTLLAELLKEVTGVGPGNTLSSEVEQAQTDYAAGNIPETCHALAEFLHELHAQDGKTILMNLDQLLTRKGQAIAATIRCH